MRRAVYPGSFDPVTFGHLDIIRRSAVLVDELIVGVLTNSAIKAFDGLSVDFARNCGAQFMVRGLRAITDFDYELQMSQTNRILRSDIDTIFLSTSLEYAYLSSTTVKEIASYHGDISKFVPESVIEKIYQKMEVSKQD